MISYIVLYNTKRLNNLFVYILFNISFPNIKLNCTMKIVLLLVILIVYCSPQVSPIWSQTIRIDTGDIILINSGIATTSWVTTWSTTYTNGVTFSNAPWVALCIILLYSQL